MYENRNPYKPKLISVSENLRRSIVRSSVSADSSISSNDGPSIIPSAMTSNSMKKKMSAAPGTDIEEFLLHFAAEHPLREQGLSNYALLVKNEDFHLYSVEQDRKPLILKVMCDPDLFYNELAVYNRLQGTQSEIRFDQAGPKSKFVL